MFLVCFCWAKKKTGKEEEMEKRGERKSWGKREIGKRVGKWEIMKEKQKNLLCGLNVGEMEIDFGYLWLFMIFINIGRNY